MEDRKVLYRQLFDLINSMERQRLTDRHFTIVYSMWKNENPSSVDQSIAKFCSDAREVLVQLTQALDEPVVDFNAMKEYTFKVKGSASCIGASQMTSTFADLLHAIDNESEEECVRALNKAKQDFLVLNEKLHSIVELERRLVLSAKQGTNPQ